MTCDARNLYAQVGMAAIPKILGLLDRHRLRPTYGCFDKSFWHYKTASFPSGMSQEFVLPLALIYQHCFPGGEVYYQHPSIKEWVRAGILYAAKAAHRDGSCDDYFPYERALGAVAFSLYACTESALLLGCNEADIVAFCRQRGQWLMHHDEAGTLANHHALAVLALYNVGLLTGEKQFHQGATQRLARLLSWQSEEGWFPEYEGCDPGYHTASIDFLAKYWQKSADQAVIEPLRRAVRLASEFVHPDGSYGGVYGSRNTCVFFPHGFEVLATQFPEAAWIASRYVHSMEAGTRVFLDDDRLIGHLTYNHLQAFVDYHPQRQTTLPSQLSSHLWSHAGLYVHRDSNLYAVISLSKGGVLTLFEGEHLCYADSGLLAQQQDGRCLVSHLVDRYPSQVAEETVRIQGTFGYAAPRLPTPLTMSVFHLGMITLGRWWSDGIRALLQKLLIIGKKPAAMRFQRTIHLRAPVTVIDEIWDERPSRQGTQQLSALWTGPDPTSIYVAMSNAYRVASLLPWHDDSAALELLQRQGYVKITRRLPVAGASLQVTYDT